MSLEATEVQLHTVDGHSLAADASLLAGSCVFACALKPAACVAGWICAGTQLAAKRETSRRPAGLHGEHWTKQGLFLRLALALAQVEESGVAWAATLSHLARHHAGMQEWSLQELELIL
eukprot:scaffold301936_cov18-Tisochrysis_lutea.AAC.1